MSNRGLLQALKILHANLTQVYGKVGKGSYASSRRLGITKREYRGITMNLQIRQALSGKKQTSRSLLTIKVSMWLILALLLAVLH